LLWVTKTNTSVALFAGSRNSGRFQQPPLPSPKGETKAEYKYKSYRQNLYLLFALVSPLGDGRGGVSRFTTTFSANNRLPKFTLPSPSEKGDVARQRDEEH
jgi:hypothetical protein